MPNRVVALLTTLAFLASGACSSLPSLPGLGGGNPPPPPATFTPQAETGAAVEGADASNYRVGPGDELRVTVYGEEDLSGQYTVDGTGVVSMPLLGQVQVGGLTLRELEVQLAQSLDANYLRNPRVSAEVLNYRPFYIIGEVMMGGEYPYQDGINVLNAVAIAGGFTFRARERGIRISRNGATYDVRDPATELVLPGDVITVPERFF